MSGGRGCFAAGDGVRRDAVENLQTAAVHFHHGQVRLDHARRRRLALRQRQRLIDGDCRVPFVAAFRTDALRQAFDLFGGNR